MDALLSWLHYHKPLWDFMTAVGTIGLASTTVWLATRKPRAKLDLSVVRVAADGAFFTIRNAGDAVLVVAGCYWAAPCLQGRVDLVHAGLFNGAGPFPLLQCRLTRGDTIEIRLTLQEIADLVNPHLPSEATAPAIAACLRESTLVCATTTGEQFQIAMPQEASEDLRRRVMLLRPGNM